MKTVKVMLCVLIPIVVIAVCFAAFMFYWNYCCFIGDVLWGNDADGGAQSLSAEDIELAAAILEQNDIAYELANDTSLLLVKQYEQDKAIDLLEHCRFESGYVTNNDSTAVVRVH